MEVDKKSAYFSCTKCCALIPVNQTDLVIKHLTKCEFDNSNSCAAAETPADPPKYECILCKTRIDSMQELHLHISLHTGVVLQCPVCLKLFTDDQVFEEHEKMHLSDKVETSQDSIEEEGYNRRLLDDEDDDLLLMMEGPNICPVCDKTFSSLDYFRIHVLMHRTNEENQEDVCKTRSKTKEQRSKDRRSQNNKRIDKRKNKLPKKKMQPKIMAFKCKLCDAEVCVNSAADIQIHIGMHTGEWVQCKICKKAFQDDTLFKNHVH